jgi:hypothetical protein
MPTAHFSFASSDFKVLGAFFCNYWQLVILAARQPGVARSGARPGTRSCRFEASEPIPFPGADSIFSSRCGAISGRLRLVVSLPRFDPGDRNATVQKIEDQLGDLLRNLGIGTNVERLRNFGKKFIERLGVTSQIQADFRKPLRQMICNFN